MAVTDQQLRGLDRDFQEDISRTRTPGTLSKPELFAAWRAIRDWVTLNQPSFNSAIPPQARSALTQAQKFALLAAVITQEIQNG